MSAPSDDQVRDLAAEILARARYAPWRPHRAIDSIQSVIAWLNDFLAWLMHLAQTRPLLYAALMLILLAASAALTAHLVYSVRLAMRASQTHAPAAAPVAPSLLEEAVRLAAAARFLEAVHHMQLAVIELLLQRDVVQLARCEPNRVLRQRLRQAHLPAAERDLLTDLLARFDRQWFRDRAADVAAFDAWHTLYRRVAALPAAPAGTAPISSGAEAQPWS